MVLFSWANRTGEWVRILCVVLGARPTSTEIQSIDVTLSSCFTLLLFSQIDSHS